MKKKQNINMLIGKVMYRSIEKMDESQLTQVALALLADMQLIQAAQHGNISKATAAELMARAKKNMQRMQQVAQFKRNLAAKAKVAKQSSLHLRFDCQGCSDHPQTAMKKLGITYQHATPQSISDQWWFWNCQNVPNELPWYLSELKLNPHDQIGNGLSKEDADKIVAYGQTPSTVAGA